MAAIAAAFLMVSCDKDQSFDEEDRAIFDASTPTPAEALLGDFSVADGKKVRFSRGNLYSSVHDDKYAFIMSSNNSVVNSDDDAYHYGYSVRLVTDVTE